MTKKIIRRVSRRILKKAARLFGRDEFYGFLLLAMSPLFFGSLYILMWMFFG